MEEEEAPQARRRRAWRRRAPAQRERERERERKRKYNPRSGRFGCVAICPSRMRVLFFCCGVWFCGRCLASFGVFCVRTGFCFFVFAFCVCVCARLAGVGNQLFCVWAVCFNYSPATLNARNSVSIADVALSSVGSGRCCCITRLGISAGFTSVLAICENQCSAPPMSTRS